MNQAHLHLLLNHIPILIPFVALLVLLGGIFFKSEAMKRTAFGMWLVAAIFTFATTFTGEGAEEVVENLADVSKKMIHDHEEWGEKLALLNYALALLAAAGLWASIKQATFARIVEWIIVALSLVGLFLAKQTGTSGGEIRHTEIRLNYTPNQQPQNGNAAPAGASEEEGEEDEH